MPRRRNPRPAWIVERHQAFGRRIRDLRDAAGLSQDNLADLAGMERRSIQRYENAVREPRYGDLLLIAQALGMTVSELLAE